MAKCRETKNQNTKFFECFYREEKITKKSVCVDKEKELKPFERVKEMHEKAFRTYWNESTTTTAAATAATYDEN